MLAKKKEDRPRDFHEVLIAMRKMKVFKTDPDPVDEGGDDVTAGRTGAPRRRREDAVAAAVRDRTSTTWKDCSPSLEADRRVVGRRGEARSAGS